MFVVMDRYQEVANAEILVLLLGLQNIKGMHTDIGGRDRS
jgi:hypothetical protein